MDTIRALCSALWSLILYLGGVLVHIVIQVITMIADLIGGGVKKGVSNIGDRMSNAIDDDEDTSIRK